MVLQRQEKKEFSLSNGHLHWNLVHRTTEFIDTFAGQMMAFFSLDSTKPDPITAMPVVVVFFLGGAWMYF